MQKEADVNKSVENFKSLKEVYGPQTKVSCTLLSGDASTTITEPNKLTERWREYFNWLLNADSLTEDSILQSLTPFKEQKYLSNAPSLTGLKAPRIETKTNKSAGADGLKPKVYNYSEEELIKRLHQLIPHSRSSGMS